MPKPVDQTQDAVLVPSTTQTHPAHSDALNSSTLLYFYRQEAASEFQWLNSLLRNPQLELNAHDLPPTLPIAYRRSLLGEQSYLETPQNTAFSPADSLGLVDSTVSRIDSTTGPKTALPTTTLPLTPKQELSTDRGINLRFWEYEVGPWLSAPDVMLLVVVFSFLLTTWIRTEFPQFMRQMFRSLLSYSELYKVYRENNLMAKRFYTSLGIVFYLNLSVFLFQNTYYFQFPWWTSSYFIQFLVLFLGVLLAYLFKRISLATVGQLFMSFRLAEEYWFSLKTINMAMGIALLPLLLAVAYVPEYMRDYSFAAVWVLLAAGFVFRLVRGLRIATEKQLSVFYMFLYFCTLEILPIVLVYKAVTMWVSAT